MKINSIFLANGNEITVSGYDNGDVIVINNKKYQVKSDAKNRWFEEVI
ncbi:hypothetical protein [Leuconostoc mesenteroides]|nr:hypothetical protein [Leuconostoc mesenteroides]MCM6831241.1 hypothetical protein [Leuconostoc mesenteroides]